MRPSEVQSLIDAIASVPAWTEAYYDEPDTQQLVNAAAACAEAPPEVLRSALEAYYLQKRKGADPTADLSRPYLLLRVIFDLPDAIDRKEAKVFGGWNHPSIFSGAPTFNLSWPVRVREGEAVAIESPFTGYRGRPYDLVSEYDYFARRFQRRR